MPSVPAGQTCVRSARLRWVTATTRQRGHPSPWPTTARSRRARPGSPVGHALPGPHVPARASPVTRAPRNHSNEGGDRHPSRHGPGARRGGYSSSPIGSDQGRSGVVGDDAGVGRRSGRRVERSGDVRRASRHVAARRNARNLESGAPPYSVVESCCRFRPPKLGRTLRVSVAIAFVEEPGSVHRGHRHRPRSLSRHS